MAASSNPHSFKQLKSVDLHMKSAVHEGFPNRVADEEIKISGQSQTLDLNGAGGRT